MKKTNTPPPLGDLGESPVPKSAQRQKLPPAEPMAKKEVGRKGILNTLKGRRIPDLNERDAMRFHGKVDSSCQDGCWPWRDVPMPNGYGNFWVKPAKYNAHRVAFFLANGDFDPTKIIMHTCDNRRCCNPAHLKLGTHTDNMRDMFFKGRCYQSTHPETMARGSRTAGSKLKEEDIPVIRRLLAEGNTLTEVGKQYGVSKSSMYCLRKGKTWKHVP